MENPWKKVLGSQESKEPMRVHVVPITMSEIADGFARFRQEKRDLAVHITSVLDSEQLYEDDVCVILEDEGYDADVIVSIIDELVEGMTEEEVFDVLTKSYHV